jgi:hypothetical protein
MINSRNLIIGIFILILCILAIYIVGGMLYYNFSKKIAQQNEQWEEKLQDDKFRALLNGSSINNLPNVNITSLNEGVTQANKCGQKPVYFGTTGTPQDCVQMCVNSDAVSITVSDAEIYIYESEMLRPGFYCLVGNKPQCNLHTTYAIMTINSHFCRPKYPAVAGSKIIACNNRMIYDSRNVLWDYLHDGPFDLYGTEITYENEILADSSYRFRCIFNGRDSINNRYVEHPFARFHPIRNYCTQYIPNAPDDITFSLDSDLKVVCDCGDTERTRLDNIIPNDPTSPCAPIQYQISNVIRNQNKVTVPIPCFNLFSPISAVTDRTPCPSDQFTRNGLQMTSTSFMMTTKLDDIIESPVYDQMPSNSLVHVQTNLVLP